MIKFALMLQLVVLPMIPLFGQQSSIATSATTLAAPAINAVGVDLLHATSHVDQNALLSPYSIETALAMTYAGADGETREEMARVLHLNTDAARVAGAFSALQGQLDSLVQDSVRESEQMKQYGQTNDPIVLDVANRLFGEQHYTFRPEFLDLLKTTFNAPLEPMDFRNNSAEATKRINSWVAQKTKDRIQNLVPNGALGRRTGLVLVNALYLKAQWAEAFPERATQPLPFHVHGAEAKNAPTMSIQKSFGYTRTNGVTVVSVPYKGNQLHFLIILPNETNGLARVEAGLSAEQLAAWASLPNQTVKLFLPKFKMQPATLPLGNALQKLGMKSAFNIPEGSANFERMAPRKPDDYLYISDVFHKTFISVDEKGTEAAAATAVAMARAAGIMRPQEPVEVKVDHPFLFAIQHRASGACLFLGHVVDPTAQQARQGPVAKVKAEYSGGW
jgi:serpin B